MAPTAVDTMSSCCLERLIKVHFVGHFEEQNKLKNRILYFAVFFQLKNRILYFAVFFQLKQIQFQVTFLPDRLIF